MEKLPNFSNALLQLVHNRIRKESTAAARSINEEGDKITRQSLLQFSQDANYEVLLKEAPLMMTVLYGSSCKLKLKQINVSIIMNQAYNCI
jgi:hypothetical protein